MVSQPQYLLFCDTHTTQPPSALDGGETLGRWHFVLDRLDHPQRLEATDCEPAIHPDRLALLSVVRGLEALDEPSHVNLVTTSRYVSRGLKYGLASWRARDYRWEHFGVQRPVRNADLWQRVDRAMSYHGVSCRLLQSQVAALPGVDQDQEQELVTTAAAASAFTGTELEGPAFDETAVETAESRGNTLPTREWVAAKELVAARNATTGPQPASMSGDAPSRSACLLLPWSPRPHDGRGTIDSGENGRFSTSTSEHRLHNPHLHLSWYTLRNWWEMAGSWFKWWRRRNQPRPAIFGM